MPGVTSYDQKTNKEKQQIKQQVLQGMFSSKTWSGLYVGVLGPENSDSSSKTTYIVLFPGLNSYIQVKMSSNLFFNPFFIDQIMVLLCLVSSSVNKTRDSQLN